MGLRSELCAGLKRFSTSGTWTIGLQQFGIATFAHNVSAVVGEDWRLVVADRTAGGASPLFHRGDVDSRESLLLWVFAKVNTLWLT